MAYTTKPKKVRMDAMPEETIAKALEDFEGRQMHAADALGISGATLSDRISRSPFLQEVVRSARERRLDRYEEVLDRLRQQDHFGAAVFVLKTLGKSRGYVESAPVIISEALVKNFETMNSEIKLAQEERKRAKQISSIECKSE